MKRPAAGLFGCVVLLLLLTAAGIASIPTLQTGTWHSMGLMGAARSGAAAVLLKDHRVLIAGGDDGTGAVTSVEVFNADGSFSAVSAMGAARAKHVAVALAGARRTRRRFTIPFRIRGPRLREGCWKGGPARRRLC